MTIDEQIAYAKEQLKTCRQGERTKVRSVIRQLERKKRGEKVDWKKTIL
jgi:hypothetical protein